MKVLSFGTVLWDIINDTDCIGGASLNLAAHLAQLNCKSYILSRVGNDLRGQKALAEIEKYNVDSSLMQLDKVHPTGTAKVFVDEDGIPSFIIPSDVAYNYIELTDILKTGLLNEEYDAFCFGTIEQMGAVTGKTIREIFKIIKSKEIFYDVNIRQNFYTQEIINYCFYVSTIVKLNEDEVRLISKLLFDAVLNEKEFIEGIIKKYSIKTVCVTRGGNGSTVYHDGKSSSVNGIKVDVMDTVGSGDAFSAGFLYYYCLTHDPYASIEAGNILGAYVASHKGAIPILDEQILSKLKQVIK